MNNVKKESNMIYFESLKDRLGNYSYDLNIIPYFIKRKNNALFKVDVNNFLELFKSHILKNSKPHIINRGVKMNEFKVNVYFKETEVTMQDIVSEVCVNELKSIYETKLV